MLYKSIYTVIVTATTKQHLLASFSASTIHPLQKFFLKRQIDTEGCIPLPKLKDQGWCHQSAS